CHRGRCLGVPPTARCRAGRETSVGRVVRRSGDRKRAYKHLKDTARTEGDVDPKYEHREHRAHHDHAAAHGHTDDRDWSEETFVANWIQRQEDHATERRPLFAKVRALIPKGLRESFRYADLGAGDGSLDELILDRF